MTNELLLIGELCITFGALLAAYRLFGKIGLFIWIPISTILANIQVLVTIESFGLVATLGNVMYGSCFLATDILAENYGRKDAKKAVAIGFFSLIFTTLIMNYILSYKSIEDAFSIEMYNHLSSIFKMMPRLALASLTAFFISQNHDIWAFEFWKQKLPGTKNLWIRNNASTIVSQILDTGIFTLIAFWGQMPVNILWQIFTTTIILKTFISFADTPFVYLGVKIHNRHKETKVELIPEIN